jgi:hypothetical protein
MVVGTLNEVIDERRKQLRNRDAVIFGVSRNRLVV